MVDTMPLYLFKALNGLKGDLSLFFNSFHTPLFPTIIQEYESCIPLLRGAQFYNLVKVVEDFLALVIQIQTIVTVVAQTQLEFSEQCVSVVETQYKRLIAVIILLVSLKNKIYSCLDELTNNPNNKPDDIMHEIQTFIVYDINQFLDYCLQMLDGLRLTIYILTLGRDPQGYHAIVWSSAFVNSNLTNKTELLVMLDNLERPVPLFLLNQRYQAEFFAE
jgi:hypothetical protein